MSPLGRFECFLLPTDGSEFSRGAEKLAIAMCGYSGGSLVVMRAVLGGGRLPRARDGCQGEQEAKDDLARLKRKVEAAGVDCTTALRFASDPYKAIVEEAKDTHADIIVMGAAVGAGSPD